jgi:hypothetical protein
MPVDYHLLIPALFIEPSHGDEYRGLDLPALQALLGHADSKPAAENNYYAWLSQSFGLPASHAIPFAPITLMADGAKPEKNYWLRADPVHLRIMRDEVRLFDADAAPLNLQEASALCATLNQHFKQDGLQFICPWPDRWYVKLANTPALTTTPIDMACGKNIDTLMPAGADSPAWRQRMNEIQMLLFEHPANVIRESGGELAINSVWFWGGGVMPLDLRSEFTQLFSDEIFSQGLAYAAKMDSEILPKNLATLLEAKSEQKSSNDKKLIIINKLHKHAVYNNAKNWRKEIQKLEREWFVPLLFAVKSGAIGSLTISVTDSPRPRDFVITKNSLRKFWRPSKPLEHYV